MADSESVERFREQMRHLQEVSRSGAEQIRSLIEAIEQLPKTTETDLAAPIRRLSRAERRGAAVTAHDWWGPR